MTFTWLFTCLYWYKFQTSILWFYFWNTNFIAFCLGCFSVPAPGDEKFVSYKCSLLSFCQRYKLPPPQYITSQGANGYYAKLKFGGLYFQSSENFNSRLVAEQQAAFEALLGLGLLPSTLDFNENDIPRSPHVSESYSRSSSTGGSRTGSKPPSKPGSRSGSRHGSFSSEGVASRANVSGDAYAIPSVGFSGGSQSSKNSSSTNVSYAYTGYNEGGVSTNNNFGVKVTPVLKENNAQTSIQISSSTGGDNQSSSSQQFSSSTQQFSSSSSYSSTSYVQVSLLFCLFTWKVYSCRIRHRSLLGFEFLRFVNFICVNSFPINKWRPNFISTEDQIPNWFY